MGDPAFQTKAVLSAARVRRLRILSRARRPLRLLILVLPLLSVLGLDLALRAPRLLKFSSHHLLSYVGSVALGGLLWGLLLLSASRRRGAIAAIYSAFFVFFFAISLGGQAYFFEQYQAYMNADVARYATDFTESVLNQIWADGRNYVSFFGPAFLLALGLLFLGRKVVRPRRTSGRRAGALGACLLLATFALPIEHRERQPSSPDVLYLHAVGSLLMTQLGLSEDSFKLRPRARKSLPLARLVARPSRPRNVVFVIGESVRKDATCNSFDPNCRRTEATNQMFPGRYPLSQMRALDSSTAISLAVLLSGVGPHESREVMHTWPLLFDYAKKAGYTTAYWTSQNLMFGNMGLFLRDLGTDSFFSGNDIDPESNIDLGADERHFARRALSEIPTLREPFFVTIQLSNGHYPYLVDEAGPRPFEPSSESKSPENNHEFFNHYQNAIHQQDQHLARVLGAFRNSPAGARTVIVYTSDHGEAFREHHQMGHTFSLYDEEILVPGWIDAPEGTLSEAEQASLVAKKEVYSFHPDLTVTVLDLLGVWDEPTLSRFKARIIGESLIRPGANHRKMPMTNCAPVWGCAFENWGYMQGHMKLEARAWDADFNCRNLASDPTEMLALRPPECAELRAQAIQTFGRLPGKDKAASLK